MWWIKPYLTPLCLCRLCVSRSAAKTGSLWQGHVRKAPCSPKSTGRWHEQRHVNVCHWNRALLLLSWKIHCNSKQLLMWLQCLSDISLSELHFVPYQLISSNWMTLTLWVWFLNDATTAFALGSSFYYSFIKVCSRTAEEKMTELDRF